MQKDLSEELFKKFEQCKKTVYNDVSLPSGPVKQSEAYRQEIDSTVRQRVSVLRERIKHLDYAEAVERKSRMSLSIDVLILLFLVILTIFIPMSFKMITLILIVMIVAKIGLNNRHNRVFLIGKARTDSPNFNLEREVMIDTQREIKSKGPINRCSDAVSSNNFD